MAKFRIGKFTSLNTFCTHNHGEALDYTLVVELRYNLKEIYVCWCSETNGQIIQIKYSTFVDYKP